MMGVVFRARIRHRRVLFPVHGHAAVMSTEPVNDYVPLSPTMAPTANLRVVAISPPMSQPQGATSVWTQGPGRQQPRSLLSSLPHAAVSGVLLADRNEHGKEVPGMIHFDPYAFDEINQLLIRGGGTGLDAYHLYNTAPSLAPFGSERAETESVADIVDILGSL